MPTAWQQLPGARVFAVETGSGRCYSRLAYHAGDGLLFGPETRGLPAELLQLLPPERHIRIPMRAGNRSLNLANAVAVVVYEAWRQNGFAIGRCVDALIELRLDRPHHQAAHHLLGRQLSYSTP